jgi:hypothetical protein
LLFQDKKFPVEAHFWWDELFYYIDLYENVNFLFQFLQAQSMWHLTAKRSLAEPKRATNGWSRYRVTISSLGNGCAGQRHTVTFTRVQNKKRKKSLPMLTEK